jgi:acyl carrier protein
MAPRYKNKVRYLIFFIKEIRVVNIKSKVEETVKEILDIHIPIDLDKDLKELGLDSMKCINLIVKIEDLFSITFNGQEFKINNFKTIGTINQLLSEKLGTEVV